MDCLHEGRTVPASFGRYKVRRELCEKPQAYRQIPRRYYRFGMSGQDFQARMRSFPRPDIILVTSVMTYWYPGVWEAVRTAKELFPGVPVVLGGIYAILCPEHADGSGADFVLTAPRSPDGTRIPMDLYDSPGYAVLSTSYGCPMRCDYGASHLLSPSFRQRPMSEIVYDMEKQLKCGSISDLAFYDDALLWDKERTFYPLCAHIRRACPGLRLHIPNGLHVSQLDGRCCRALFETGFETIRLSFEGMDDYTRRASSQKVAAVDYALAVKNLMHAGYAPERIETYILIGLPGQETDDIERSIDYVKALGCRPKLAEFSPIPGTSLYRKAAELVPAIGDEPLLHNNTVFTQYIARTIIPEKLQELKNRARAFSS